MRNPADEELRSRCLDLASRIGLTTTRDVVSAANDFHAFVTGALDQSPRDKISAALTEAGVR